MRGRRNLARRTEIDGQLEAQLEFDRLKEERQQNRRVAERAQFILDEETAQEYIEVNLKLHDVNVECLKQNMARVYLIERSLK